MVPHLHWHVIPRYRDDRHFPAPVWGQPQREALPASLQVRRERLAGLRTKMRERLATYL
jgi:diadenosine tetraphosphate (Ap4A) HIT family hydrolase